MRDPDMLNIITDDGRDSDIITIDNIPEYNIEDYDFYDEKEMFRFLNDVKRECRQSFEYKQMINYLRNYLDMNKCSFYESVDNMDSKRIKIEIHHEPFTLDDICRIVYNKRIEYDEIITVEQVAKEVMYLHYKMKIGLIPLSETVHELVHNQYLFIPADAVLGQYKDFVNMYERFMEPEQVYILDSILEATKNYRGNNMQVLTRKYVYVDASGQFDIPKLEDIKTMMKNKINMVQDEVDPYQFTNNSSPSPVEIVIE